MISPTRNLLKIFFHNNCRILNRLHAEDNIVLEKINIRKSLFNYKFLHTLQLNKDGRKIMILIKQTELQTFNFLETKVGENGMNERVSYGLKESKGNNMSVHTAKFNQIYLREEMKLTMSTPWLLIENSKIYFPACVYLSTFALTSLFRFVKIISTIILDNLLLMLFPLLIMHSFFYFHIDDYWKCCQLKMKFSRGK